MSRTDFPARSSDRGRYRFGDFVLDLDAGFLRRNGAEVPLRPKAFEVLRYLVLHRGTLVSKDELARAVWADVAVTDNSLAQCLLEVRRVLGDHDQRIVRTVARRGYVFDAPVEPDPVRTDAPAAALVVATPVPESRPAVPAESRARARSWRPVAAALVVVGGALAAWSMTGSRPSADVESAPVQLTNLNGSVTAPALSHDGRLLAFIRGGTFGRVGAPGGQVYLQTLEGGEPTPLTADSMDKTLPVFSPDDSRIVYTTLLPGLRWDSWQVPVRGGTPQPYLPNASGLQWLRDGRLVFATIRSGIHMGIATSNESRGDYRDVYFPPHPDGMAHRSALSPDGKWLLVVEMLAGTWQPCRLVPFDGSSSGQPVSPPDAQCTTVAWSPDGRWMYFSSNAGGEFHIWRRGFPDGSLEQITFGPTEQEGTAVTADGRFLVTSMGLQQASIWLHDAGGERRLTDEGLVVRPVLSASGTGLFYLVRTALSRADASGELWQLDIASGERQRVLPGLVLANYSMSPDDKAVVYSPSTGATDDGLWIAQLDRHEPPRQLVRGSGLRGFFGAPGEIIYEGEDGFLYRISVDGLTTERASEERVSYLVSVSPDGRWAQAVVPRSSGAGTTSLRFVSLRGQRSFDVCSEQCSVGPRSFQVTAPFAWTRDGGHMLVNLSHFGSSATGSVLLPYRTDAPPDVLWPSGLDTATDLVRNPGARMISQASALPGAGPSSYLIARWSIQSNLYRLPLPD